MATHVCNVSLTAEAVQAVYAGTLRYVQATSREGVRLRFPIAWLRPYVTHSGIEGTFVLTIGDDNKLRSLERLTVPAARRPVGRGLRA